MWTTMRPPPTLRHRTSLLGNTHVHGPEGVRFHTRAKAVATRRPWAPGAASPSLPTAE